MPDLKICTKCGRKKPLSEFVIERARLDGLRPDCKDCCRTRCREWRRKQGPMYGRIRDLEKLYNLNWNDFIGMLEDQNYKCAICNQTITATAKQSDRKKVAQVDHNHTTGRLRGLLCNACNIGVGMFQDSQLFTFQASEYLKYFDGEEDA